MHDMAGNGSGELSASERCGPEAVRAQTPRQAASLTLKGCLVGRFEEQLDALVASVALYPDDLLTQVLMASTLSAGGCGGRALGDR
jgi:Protein of unknown function (DUF3300)